MEMIGTTIVSSELRPGNWVSLEGVGLFQWEPSIKFDVERVPLTHAILKKTGLNTSIENIVYDLPGCWQYKGVKFRFVHELQNLHFDLTGEELTIDL